MVEVRECCYICDYFIQGYGELGLPSCTVNGTFYLNSLNTTERCNGRDFKLNRGLLNEELNVKKTQQTTEAKD